MRCLLAVLVLGCFQQANSLKIHHPDFAINCSQVVRDGYSLQLVPEKKFAFCIVPKVASSRFALMMDHLNGYDFDFQFDVMGVLRTFAASTAWAQGFCPEQVTKENGWTLAAFVMDPLVRFRSEFHSKCIVHNGTLEDGGRNCLGPVIPENATAEDEAVAFEQQALELARDNTTLLRETDAELQSRIIRKCFGGRAFQLADMDFIGVLTESQSCNNAQVKKMLQIGGFNASKAEAMANEAFSENSDRLHAYNSGDLHSMFYRNRSTVEAVTRAYARDMQLYEKQVSAQRLETCA
jgi:hypothetical protein